MHTLDDDLDQQSGYTGTTRWMVPYADFLTLLLGFFIIFFGMVKLENTDLKHHAETDRQALAQAKAELEEARRHQVVRQETAGTLIQSNALYKAPQAADPHQAQVTLDQLEDSLAHDLNLKGQQVTVSQDARGLVISFQDRIFFQPGNALLSPAATQTLDTLAEVLKKAHHPIRVEGHTDNTPIQTAQFPSNWELSTARSTTIVRNLVERHHFAPQQLSAAGYGEYYPLAENSTIEGKQKNRRVDIVLLDPLPGVSSTDAKVSPQPGRVLPKTKE